MTAKGQFKFSQIKIQSLQKVEELSQWHIKNLSKYFVSKKKSYFMKKHT